MVKTAFIYALCEPGTRTVRYIGQSVKPTRRLTDHLCRCLSSRTHLGNWLRGLRLRGQVPSLEIIREVSISDWGKAERAFIRLARGLGMNLVNGTDGGEGTLNPSAERRAAVSARHRGKVVSPETRARISKRKQGHSVSAETRAKISVSKKGVLKSEQTRLRMSKARLGKPRTQKVRENMRAGWVLRKKKSLTKVISRAIL